MKLFVLASTTLLFLLDLSLAVPQPRAQCTTPKLRKEWSSTTATEKSTYIAAVKCLATKPSKVGLTSTLYDDFTYVHGNLDKRIHHTAQFLPWHRYFIHLYEKELIACGYTGALPYWDWEAAAAGNVTQAAIWSSTNGFGGDGRRTADASLLDQCVTNGPFTSLRPTYWNYAENPHCINRQWYRAVPGVSRELLADRYNTTVMNSVRANTVFSTFAPALEEGPHSGVHGGIGGEMTVPIGSTNDPIFFLHHAQIDRVWWLWQQKNPSVRNSDYSGMEYANQPATLDTVLSMFDFAPDRVVRDFMTTSNNDLCYKY